MTMTDMEWYFLNNTAGKIKCEAFVTMNLYPNLLCTADAFISCMISIAYKLPVIWRIALLFVVCIGQ